MKEDLMGVKGAMAKWDVSEATVKLWCKSGKVEAFQLDEEHGGRVWIIKRDQPNPKEEK